MEPDRPASGNYLTVTFGHLVIVKASIHTTRYLMWTDFQWYGRLFMEVRFLDSSLDRLEVDIAYDAGLPRPVVRSFRKVMQVIRAAPDERDLYGIKSYHFEKLKGDRKGQHSIRLNNQWRLILRLRKAAQKATVELLGIEDYH